MTALLAHNARVTPTSITGLSTVTGTIFDPSGYPLAGISIRLYDDSHDSLTDSTTTDDAGRFRFPQVLTDGTDRFRVEAEDLTGNHVYACSPTFVVKAGRPTTRDLTMKPAGIIEGRVATNHLVLCTAEGRYVTGEVTTSANGTFRLGGLPTGTYTVTFEDLTDQDRAAQAKVKVAAGSTTTLKPQALSNRRA